MPLTITLTEEQSRIVIKAMRDRLRYIRQRTRQIGWLTPELQEKRIETIAVIQTLGGTYNEATN